MPYMVSSCWKRAVCLVLLLGCLGRSLPSSGQTNQTSRAEEWERAAENREVAAQAQQGESARMLDVAKGLIRKGCATEAERRKNLTQAAELCSAAGELASLAAANYEKASRNWLASAAELVRESSGRPKRLADEMADKARQNRRSSLQSAAEAHEMSADIYAPGNAELPIRSAQSSEKAASLRELIADLK